MVIIFMSSGRWAWRLDHKACILIRGDIFRTHMSSCWYSTVCVPLDHNDFSTACSVYPAYLHIGLIVWILMLAGWCAYWASGHAGFFVAVLFRSVHQLFRIPAVPVRATCVSCPVSQGWGTNSSVHFSRDRGDCSRHTSVHIGVLPASFFGFQYCALFELLCLQLARRAAIQLTHVYNHNLSSL